MTQKNRHRGQHPADKKLFSNKFLPAIRNAVKDFSMLLSMDYPEKSSLKLVGDKFRLTERQRKVVARAACSDIAEENRNLKEISPEKVEKQILYIDGFNLLIGLESALSGGLVFVGKDGSYRDQASVHGSYKKVVETENSLHLVGSYLEQLKIQKVHWYFDQPVSNSGRLKVLLYEISSKNNWNWEIDLVFNPDKVLMETKGIIISSDALILDHCQNWFNLLKHIIQDKIKEAQVISLG